LTDRLIIIIICFLVLYNIYRAFEILSCNDDSVNNIAYKVKVDELDKDLALVHCVDNHILRTTVYSVNLREKTCTCHHYQQSGVPCFHAIAMLRCLGIILDNSYFYDFCLNINLALMFEKKHLYTTVFPDENTIYQLMKSDQYINIDNLIPLLQEVSDDNTGLTTSKRYTSVGEKGKAG